MQTIRLDTLGFGDGMRALDLGCGAGRHLHAMYYKAHADVVGVDLGFEDVVRTRQGFETYPDIVAPEKRSFGLAVADALTLPFPSGTFDAIICSEVLEHIPDYKGAIAEIIRVLKPGGRLGVSVPRAFPEWVCWKLERRYHETPGGHVRIFRTSGLKRDITSAGARFTHRHWAHGLHSPYWWLQCALWDKRETSRMVGAYRKFLEWDILQRPLLTRVLEKIADPLMGKSVVLYFTKAAA